MQIDEIREKFPMQLAIWNNDYQKLEELLEEKKV